jgi:hypothetical protein
MPKFFTKYILIIIIILYYYFFIIHQLTCIINWFINGVVWILSQHKSNKKKMKHQYMHGVLIST